MTKGELRRIRKQEGSQGRTCHHEVSAEGNRIIHERTPREEKKHRDGWAHWAAKYSDRD